jgi:phosphohistidine phosphatase
MKHLLLLRHAKSSWDHPSLADHQRPLNRRGERDAPRMGRWICQHNLEPDLVISSSAVRAEQTAQAVVMECDTGEPLQVLDELYHAPADTYLSVLARLPDQVERVLMVGHNPGIESLLEWLSGEPARMPTAALAHLLISVDSWQHFDSPAAAQLDGFWIPRDLD